MKYRVKVPLARMVRGFGSRLVHPVSVSLLAALLGWALIQSPVWRYVELKAYDLLVVYTAPKEVTLPITIIGIDEATLNELKSAWPIPRRHHAKLLQNLGEAGVAVVAFDIPFAEQADPQDDLPFMAAVQKFRRVVLASDLAFREDATVRQWYRVDPHPQFALAGAAHGFSSMQLDGDAILRRVPTVRDAFWRAIVTEFEKIRPGTSARLDADEDMRIRYFGGPRTFTYIPYYQLLDPQQYLPLTWREFFRDNIVLVGRNQSVIDDVGTAQSEMYQTPFFFKTREFMPRVEVQANLVANMITGDVLREAPAKWVMGTWLATVIISVFFMRRWHPLQNGLLLGLSVALLAAFEYGMFQFLRVWVPAVGAMATAALIYVSQGIVAFFTEQRRQRELRSAFSRYVSPELVDEVMAHPERLKLGGERREITILFSDLAGFTSISERLEPEQVASILNRHLSSMTDAILERAGTVDKFTGDGIMAFWGAPIADSRQSEYAILAAIDMQQRAEAMSAGILAEFGMPLNMRIGINRGECIVGNLGGDQRFEYGAIGDPANLASRMEGVNKVYGTKILVTESVVVAAGNMLRFREVDTVRVKGKQIGIDIYTPCEDDTLIAMSAEALAAYRAGNFEEAAAEWERLLARYPGDTVAAVFLARIALFRAQGRREAWDGVTTLEEK